MLVRLRRGRNEPAVPAGLNGRGGVVRGLRGLADSGRHLKVKSFGRSASSNVKISDSLLIAGDGSHLMTGRFAKRTFGFR